MFIQIIDKKYQEAWNRVAKHPLQTWEWGTVKETAGNKILRVANIDTSNKLTEVVLFSLHSLPFGYIMASCARSVWPSSDLLKFAQSILAKNNCIFIKLEPDIFQEAAGVYRIPLMLKSWLQDGLKMSLSSSRVFAQHTFILPTLLGEEKLLQNMKPKTRYNIRLAEKKGVVVKDVSEDNNGFSDFYQLYQQTVKRQNYLGHGRAYHETVWNLMKPYSKILVAYFEGKPLSAYHLMFFNKTAYYVYGGSSDEHKDVMASNLLMWEAIKVAKKMGCTQFDMWGALPKTYNPNDPWAGFHRFKEGYGGIHESYIGSIDVILKPLEYRVFSLLWPLRTKLLEVRQSFYHTT